jgi:hypothetical protein
MKLEISQLMYFIGWLQISITKLNLPKPEVKIMSTFFAAKKRQFFLWIQYYYLIYQEFINCCVLNKSCQNFYLFRQKCQQNLNIDLSNRSIFSHTNSFCWREIVNFHLDSCTFEPPRYISWSSRYPCHYLY